MSTKSVFQLLLILPQFCSIDGYSGLLSQYQPSVLKAPTRRIQESSKDWQDQLVPKPWENAQGADATLYWETGHRFDGGESSHAAAKRLLELAGKYKRDYKNYGSKLKYASLITDLEASMQAFSDFCDRNVPDCKTIRVHLVATRGPAGGNQCPEWRLDQVPARWIQTMTGPGTLWQEDTEDQENTEKVLVRQARPGEAVVLLGSEWNDNHKDDEVRPAMHKSPEILSPFQGRVLLTMDALLESNNKE